MAYYGNGIGSPCSVTPIQQVQNGGMIWVQGEAAAKSYMVAPGMTVALWDSESETIYLKSTDLTGMPSMRILEYTERKTKTHEPSKEDYISREEFDSLKSELEALKNKLTSEA